jgi:hypothetical protein
MVLPVQGTNLEPGEVEAVGQMVAAAYQIEAKDTVVPPSQSKAAVDETGDYQKAAQKLGATEYIHVSAVRLDQRIVLTASRYTADGRLVHSAKMSATSLDDIEPASERLARALVNRTSTSATRTMDNVTQTEGQVPNRTNAQKVAGLKGSFTFPIGWTETLSPQASGAVDVRFEGKNHFIEFGIGITVAAGDDNPGYGGLWTDVGANLYLTESITAPYLGVGLMPRLMSETVANLAPYAQFGVMFMRDSKTRFYTDFRVAQNLLPVGDSYTSSDDPLDVETRRFYPTELTLSIGLGL